MNVRFLLAASLLAGGCGAFLNYDNRSQMSDPQQKAYARVEGYYLGKAHDQAAFTLDCAPDQVKTRVVSTSEGRVSFYDGEGTWVGLTHGEQIATIGAEGCGRRASYLVMCGPQQEYANLGSSSKPCDVVPSSDAVRTAQQNAVEQQQQLDAEAARRNNESHH